MKKTIGMFAAMLLLGSLAAQAGLYFVSIPFSQNDAIDYAGELDEYIFTAPTSGQYSFYTTGSTDTWGEIWYMSGTSWLWADTNDDGDDDGLTGYGLNFCVDAYLFAGEVAEIEVSHFSSAGTGAYTVYGQTGSCANMSSGDSGSLGLLTILASFMTLMVLRLRKRA